MYVASRSTGSRTVVMRWYVSVGLCLVQGAYIIMGGFVFHFLESSHEKEFVNKTLTIYLDLMREYSS